MFDRRGSKVLRPLWTITTIIWREGGMNRHEEFPIARVHPRLARLSRVHHRPRELDDLLHLVFLAEPIPPKQFEKSGWRSERFFLNRYLWRPLFNENVLAWVEEIGGAGDTADLDALDSFEEFGLHEGADYGLSFPE